MKRSVLVLVLAALSGCAVNPVTGDRDLILVSGQQEIAMGMQNYVPMQQSQGGPYDVDPELTQFVRSVGMKVARASGVDLPYEFIVLNNSVPNAWALPGGKIAINRGLLTEMKSEAELAAVLGHEVVHAAARHSAQQQSRGMLTQGLVVATTIAANDSSYRDLVAAGAGLAGQLTLMKYGRGAELESDKYGMRYMSKAGYDPQGAVSLQETFVRLSEGRNEDWLSGLFASHPPSRERVNANRKRLKNLPAGGIVGTERYRAAMARTLRVKPAYDAYDEGRKALADGDRKEALARAEEAIGLFPDEAHFYGLRGDIRYLDEEYEMAVGNYDIAIRRRDDFFQYYLQRGLARGKLGRDGDAIADLERSNMLFPTALASYELGNLEAKRGNVSKAIEYYTPVAQTQGELGQAAAEKLVRLDLAQNPGKYLEHGCYADGNGNLVVAIRNGTRVAVSDIRFVIRYRDSAGVMRTREESIRGPVAAGQRADRGTGIGPYTSAAGCPVEITAATVADQ